MKYLRLELVKTKIRGVIDIGAHIALEYEDFIEYGIQDMIFIEPLTENFRRLTERLPANDNIKFFNTALGSFTGEVDMYVETINGGQSCSILEPGTHLQTHPHIVFDKRERVKIDLLDNLDFSRSAYNMINIDVQGYELEVLRGATETLNYIDVIFAEVNVGEVYKGCCKLDELDAFLVGFDRIFCEINSGGYGDAIYERR
jgi:FkbM family methyltransferase